MEKKYYEYVKVPWTEHSVRLSTGISMHYCICGPGDGIPVLLLHGVTDGRVSWAQVAPKLAEKGYICYIPEYRGNGMTDKPDMGKEGYTARLLAEDMMDFVKQINSSIRFVVGHSFGSLIAQELCLEYPEQWDCLVLIDTAACCIENPALRKVLYGGDGFAGVENLKDEVPETFVGEWTDTSNEVEGFRTATYLHARQLPLTAWKNLMNGLCSYDERERLFQIHKPVLILWGTDDTIFTKRDQKEVLKGLSQADVTFREIQGASHNGFWDSLENAWKYACLIGDFIKKYSTRK